MKKILAALLLMTLSTAALAGSIGVTPGSGTSIGAGTDGSAQIPATILCGATSSATLYATCVNQVFVNASGQMGITGPVTQSGTWTVQPGNTANTTAWLVTGTGGTFPVTGTFWQATQPVSISGNQAVNTAQVNGVTTLTGTGAVGTGSQRVAVGTDTATIAGSAPSTVLQTNSAQWGGTAITNVPTAVGTAGTGNTPTVNAYIVGGGSSLTWPGTAAVTNYGTPPTGTVPAVNAATTATANAYAAGYSPDIGNCSTTSPWSGTGTPSLCSLLWGIYNGATSSYNYQQVPTGPITVTTANSYTAGQAFGGLQTISFFRTTTQPTALLTQFSMLLTPTYSTEPTLLFYVFTKNPTSTTCTDTSAFSLNSADAPYLIPGSPFTITPTVPTAGGNNAAIGTAPAGILPVSVQNQDTSPTANLYVCEVVGVAFTSASGTVGPVLNLGGIRD